MLEKILRAHNWVLPTPLRLKKGDILVSEEEREVRRIWIKEEIENLGLKPTWDSRDPLNEEELEELAAQLVEAEIEYEGEGGRGVPWYLQKIYKEDFPGVKFSEKKVGIFPGRQLTQGVQSRGEGGLFICLSGAHSPAHSP